MTTCPHGLESGQCLICRTLGTTPPSEVRTDERAKAGLFGRHPGAVKPDVVYVPSEAKAKRPTSLGIRLGLGLIAIAVIIVVVWTVVGLALALLRIIELVLVAAAAGWAGYRLGHYRGSHQRH